jgi:hypothetical protein
MQVKTMRVWTRAYRPFIMGGDVNRHICTDVQVQGPIELGRGYKAWVLVKPTGGCLYVEEVTKALIGDDLEMIKNDVAAADVQVMDKQLSDESRNGKTASYVSPDEFFRLLK